MRRFQVNNSLWAQSVKYCVCVGSGKVATFGSRITKSRPSGRDSLWRRFPLSLWQEDVMSLCVTIFKTSRIAQLFPLLLLLFAFDTRGKLMKANDLTLPHR